MMFDYCQSHALSCYYYYKNQLVAKVLGGRSGGKRSVSFTCFDNHCFLYRDAAWCRQAREGVQPTIARRAQTEQTNKAPPMSEWRPWVGELEEGRFWTAEDLGAYNGTQAQAAPHLRQGHRPGGCARQAIDL